MSDVPSTWIRKKSSEGNQTSRLHCLEYLIDQRRKPKILTKSRQKKINMEMKKTIVTKMLPLMLMAGFSLVASCKKEQNAGKMDSIEAQARNGNAYGKIDTSTCAPIPGTLNVPEGNKLVLQTFAEGFQIYQVKRKATDPNAFEWVNIAPSATLYAKPEFVNPLIDHFAGPSWQFIKGPEKGETVVATRSQGVTVDPTAIQWLLLAAVPELSTPNNKITFIQRICTVGGLAPSTVPNESNLGKIDSIPYTASYLFYEKD